jgi:glutamate--cysteine ligase
MDSLYLPYATSLRMSDLGYQNFSQSNIKVSLNSLDSYIYDLYRATNVDDTNFNFQPKSSNYFQQLNTNQLQIEDEFYAVSRPKNSVVSDARITSKLKMFGVDYVELRSVDIDPFSSIGIEQSTAKFLEAFVMFCAFSPSPLLNNNDIEAIRKNDLLVAREGRKPDLELINNNQGIKLKTWAIQILESMELFFDVFDIDTKIYKERVENPENTISAKFLSSIMSSNMDLNEFAIDISNENKESFLRIKKEENKKWNMLEKEVIDSKAKQAKLEKNESIKFYQFLENYFNS